MSELLHIFGEIDSRVRPLIFAVRYWASQIGLTNDSPGGTITNFSLTCFVICFLQLLEDPILPTLNQLIKSARLEDCRITDDNINCTFLRDLSTVKFQTSNTTSLELLLIEFFQFCATVDFDTRAFSLHDTKVTVKRNSSPFYIVNPLEPELNVSRNVTYNERDRIQVAAANALEVLLRSSPSENKLPKWGLLEFQNCNASIKKKKK